MAILKIKWLTPSDSAKYVGAPYTRAGFEREVFKLTESSRPLAVGDSPLDSASYDALRSSPLGLAEWIVDGDNNLHTPPFEGKSCRIITDLHAKHHYNDPTWRQYLLRLDNKKYTRVFSRYLGLPGKRNLIRDRGYTWLPWSTDTDVFVPKQKSIDIAFIGRTSPVHYPLRQKMKEYVEGLDPQWKTFVAESPTGKTFDRLVENNLAGERYASILSKARIVVFDCSVYKYPLQKFFEGIASGCVVLSTRPIGAEELGLIDCETYVNVNKGNWEGAIDYWLGEHSECAKISNKARELAVNKHSHRVRAEQFVEELRKW